MSSSVVENRANRAKHVTVTDETLVVELADGRAISVPLSWFPRLTNATSDERSDWRLIGKGVGIHWPQLDEDIEIDALLAGLPSNESPTSFRRWLKARALAGVDRKSSKGRRTKRSSR